MGRKLLTRNEMWEAIKSKYKTLRVFFINDRWKDFYVYRSREELFNIIVEMKIHKSRHLNKKQKQKAQYELNLVVLEKL